jgi:hypothetical protein
MAMRYAHGFLVGKRLGKRRQKRRADIIKMNLRDTGSEVDGTSLGSCRTAACGVSGVKLRPLIPKCSDGEPLYGCDNNTSELTSSGTNMLSVSVCASMQ